MTSNSRACCLTPAATGAIATIALAGPDAWSIARELFTSAKGNALPDQSATARFWYGRFGADPGDEVVLAYKPGEVPSVEIHCHGGRQVVRWLLQLLQNAGCIIVEAAQWPRPPETWEEAAQQLLPQARTLRTAAILLDQASGAFSRAMQAPTREKLSRLAQLIPVGRHLLEPWKIAVAGEPNVGKSSLMNALAGYQRSVVAPIPGTTRDVVTSLLSFDGWPVELLDTAGLRDSDDPLEREGIARARQALGACDLCLWVVDASAPEPPPLPLWAETQALPVAHILPVINKIDVPAAWDLERLPGPRIVATQNSGIAELIETLTARLAPYMPELGEAVPFTPALCDWIERMTP